MIEMWELNKYELKNEVKIGQNKTILNIQREH